MSIKGMIKIAAICVIPALTGCAGFDRLATITQAPPLSAIENPVKQVGYKPVTLPMPRAEHAAYNPNSLWRTGARAFFKDQRAHQVGDILTVKIDITDKAEFDNKSERSRKGVDAVALNGLAGYQAAIKKLLPNSDSIDLSKFFDVEGSSSSEGEGAVERQEKLETEMAAVVTQRLPNNNLVIEGRQEIRVNFEVREIIVAGIIRPEDISAENTIPISKIAEARVSYGGRGRLTDVQQPRYGQQFLEVVLPF